MALVFRIETKFDSSKPTKLRMNSLMERKRILAELSVTKLK